MTSRTFTWSRSGMDGMGPVSRGAALRTSGSPPPSDAGFPRIADKAPNSVAGYRPGAMQVLAVNAGSSSLKLRLLGAGDELLAAVELAAPAGRADPVQLHEALDGMRTAEAIAHRVVH